MAADEIIPPDPEESIEEAEELVEPDPIPEDAIVEEANDENLPEEELRRCRICPIQTAP